MFEVFNMGLGFCYVVDPASADHTLAILKARSRPRTPPAPPQAAWAPSTWVAAPLVLAPNNARAAVGFGPGLSVLSSAFFRARCISPCRALGAFSPSRALGVFPSPLWGGVRGGGRCVRQGQCITASPPSRPLPHKGGGSRPSSPLALECAQQQRPGNLRTEFF